MDFKEGWRAELEDQQRIHCFLRVGVGWDWGEVRKNDRGCVERLQTFFERGLQRFSGGLVIRHRHSQELKGAFMAVAEYLVGPREREGEARLRTESPNADHRHERANQHFAPVFHQCPRRRGRIRRGIGIYLAGAFGFRVPSFPVVCPSRGASKLTRSPHGFALHSIYAQHVEIERRFQ